MTVALVAPALLALIAATAGGWVRRRVPPEVAVVLLTALAVLGATAVLWALTLVVIGGVIGVPALMNELGWCRRVLAASHRAPPGVGIGAAVLLIAGVTRAVLFDRRWRRALHPYRGGGGLQIVPTGAKLAFAAPGRPGTVVVSDGLLDALDAAEAAAVIAHERSHLVRHHGRYLRIAGTAAAAVPVLRPLTRQLRFATERAADEDAVLAVGDRQVVARAILHAALVTGPKWSLGIGGDTVADRVRDLMQPRRSRWLLVVTALSAVVAASAAVTASTIQLHHLLAFSAHACGLD